MRIVCILLLNALQVLYGHPQPRTVFGGKWLMVYVRNSFVSIYFLTSNSFFLSEIHSFLSIFLTLNSFFPRTVRNSFVSICFYLFSHFELFLPTNTHPLNTCSHFRYDLTTCSFPLISFRFHHSHQVRTIVNISEVDSKDLSKIGTIYSRGSSPGTFSHLIPYHKASPIDSLDAHSSTNS